MNTTITRRSMAMMAVLGLAASLTAATEMRFKTRLAGAAIHGLTPSGSAEFRARDSRSSASVQVEDVNLPEGTVLTVSFMRGTMKTEIGKIQVGPAPVRGGELELNTQDGDSVPRLQKGDVVHVHGPSGAVILAGAL